MLTEGIKVTFYYIIVPGELTVYISADKAGLFLYKQAVIKVTVSIHGTLLR